MTWLSERTLGETAALVAAVVVALGWLRKKFWPGLRDLVLGLVDLVGAPARGSRPARPGLLATVEELVKQVEGVQSEQVEQGKRMSRVEGVAAEAASASVANSDQLAHVVEQVTALDMKVDDVASAQHALAAEQTQIRSVVEDIRSSATPPAPADEAPAPDADPTA